MIYKAFKMLSMSGAVASLSGCAFYSTYPTYDFAQKSVPRIKTSVEFTGDLFKKQLRSTGSVVGVAYEDVYVGRTSATTTEWQDPNADRFVDRFESAGIAVRSPNPTYTVDVKHYCNGEQNLRARLLSYIGSLTFISRTENLYYIQVRVYERRTGDLIVKKLIPFTGYTLRALLQS